MTAAIRHDQEQRVFFDGSVVLQPAGDEPRRGRALNLSRGGMFVCAEKHLLPSTELTVRFVLPDGADITAGARVVRVINPRDELEPPGMALQFEIMTNDAVQRLDAFIRQRVKPGPGEALRIELGELGLPIRTQAHSSWDNVLSVEAELPFLRLGSPVSVPPQAGVGGDGKGAIRWVSVHVAPDTGVPRINIGIELDPEEEADAEAFDPDGTTVEEDPILTADFAEQACQLDQSLREERRQVG
jgi:hypothetical protein